MALIRVSPVEGLLLLFTVLYAVVSRVPLVLLPIYMHQELGFSYFLTGVTDALISVGRLVGAHVAGMHAGIVTIVLGMLSGILAWVLILQFDERLVFIFACFVVGLTEVVTGVDVMLKVESLLLRRPADETQMIFRIQLIATTAGVVIAYMGGGVIYWFLGVRVLGIVNMVILGTSLICLVLVARQRKVYNQGFIRIGYIQEELDAIDEAKDTDGVPRSSFGFASALPQPPLSSPPTISSLSQSQSPVPQRPSRHQGSSSSVGGSSRQSSVGSQWSGERVNRLRSMVSVKSHSGPINPRAVVSMMSVDSLTVVETTPFGKTLTPPEAKQKDVLATRSFLAVVVACFFFTTFGISTQFAICIVYWSVVWDKGSHISGSFMAAGETLGMLILMVLTHPAVFNSRFTANHGKPANVINATALMAILAFVTATDSLVLCAIGTMGIHVCNVLIHSFQAEMIGSCTKTDEFPRWIARSYVVKRLANTLGVFSSLAVLGALGPQTSYHAVGAGLAVYAVLTFTVCWWLGVLPYQRHRVKAAAIAQQEVPNIKIRDSKESVVVESLPSVYESDEPEAEAPVAPVPREERPSQKSGASNVSYLFPPDDSYHVQPQSPTICKMSL